MSGAEFLSVEDLIDLTRRLRCGPVRDVGLLDAAVARARSSAFGEDAYPTLELKAATLLQSVVRNHALVDGNKRLGWLACMVFLDLNGAEPGLDDDAAFELVMAVARGELDVPATADRLCATARSREG